MNSEVISNSPPFRSDYGEYSKMITPYTHDVYNAALFSIEDIYAIETNPADVTIENSNAINNPTATQIIFDLSNDPTLIDTDGDEIYTEDHLILGLRGVSDGLGNNHNQLILSPDGKTITYTPLPGYFGRAEFGLFLNDGKELGAVEVYTVDLLIDPDVQDYGIEEFVINGSFEDGMEVRTWEESNKIYTNSIQWQSDSQIHYGRLGLGGGTLFSHWLAKSLVKHSADLNPAFPEQDNGFGNYGRLSNGTPSSSTAPVASFSSSVENNSRYINYNRFFSKLRYDLQPGEFYSLSFEFAAPEPRPSTPDSWVFQVGDEVNLQIEVVEDVVNIFDYNNIQSIPIIASIDFLVSDDIEVDWQDAELNFQYCGSEPTNLIRFDHASIRFYIDNLSIVQIEPIELIVDAGPDIVLILNCDENTAELYAEPSYESCNLTYSWSPIDGLSDPSVQDPIATPTQTTTYTVTVTDQSTGQTATDDVTVTVNSFSDVEDFIVCIDELPLDLNELVPFEDVTFQVNFVDQPDGMFDVTTVGVYFVQYFVETSECSFEGFFLITAEGVTQATATHPNGLTLNSSQNFSGDYQFLDDLIIQDGATVTFNNSELQFSENARIHIEPGGRLDLNGFTVKELDCGTFWEGIYVEGISSISQYGSESLLQGRLELINSTVKSALRGVANYDQSNDISSHGGIIRTMNSQFINCEIAAEVKRYNNIHPVTGQHLDIKCRFYNTDFYLDENYQFVNSISNPVMKLQAVKGVLISGCNFLNTNSDLFTPPNNSPQKAAIWSNYKTSFKITKGCNGYPPYAYNTSDYSCASGDVSTSIRGFNYGIYNIGNNPSVIDEVTFECYRGVWNRSKSLRLTRNNFRPITDAMLPFVGQDDGPDPNWEVPYGAYLDNSTLFWLEGNSFNYSGNPGREVGFFVKSSGSNTHTVFRNTFTNTWVGSLAYDDNRGLDEFSGLKYECNTISGGTVDIAVFSSVANPDPEWGISEWQGNSIINKSAANDFLTSNLFNLYNGLDGNIVYFHNPSENFQTYASPINVQPQGSNAFDNACESSFPTSGFVIEGLLAQEKAAVDSTENLLYELVDGGNSAALTTEVILADYSEALELYYELMDYSPSLSEEVLIEAINKEFDLPAPLLTIILQSNPHAAKSVKIQNELDQRMNPLDVYQREMINEGLELISYKEQLEASISYHKTRANFLLNRVIHEIIADTAEVYKLQAIADAVDGYRTTDHYYLVVDLYLAQGQIAQAQNMLNKVGQHFELDARKSAEYTDYQSIYSILFNLENNNLDSLSSTEIQLLEEIAEKKSTLASGLAKNVLTAYAGYEYPEVLVEPFFDLDGKSNTTKSKNKDDFREMSLYPNPSRGLVFIKGYEGENYRVQIYNGFGQEVQESILSDTSGAIDMTGLPAGIYSIVVRERDGGIIHKDQIVLIR